MLAPGEQYFDAPVVPQDLATLARKGAAQSDSCGTFGYYTVRFQGGAAAQWGTSFAPTQVKSHAARNARFRNEEA